jgi:hypothetical protein
MKYVVMKVRIKGGMDMELPVVFPNSLVHKDMADALRMVIHESLDNVVHTEPVSAGEVSLFGTGLNCSGYSETLNLHSRGSRDSTLLVGCDYGAGIL